MNATLTQLEVVTAEKNQLKHNLAEMPDKATIEETETELVKANARITALDMALKVKTEMNQSMFNDISKHEARNEEFEILVNKLKNR